MKNILKRVFALTLCFTLLASCGTDPSADGVEDETQTTISGDTTPTNETKPTTLTSEEEYYYEESIIAQTDEGKVYCRLIDLEDSGEFIYLERAFSDIYMISRHTDDFEFSNYISKTDTGRMSDELEHYTRQDRSDIMEMVLGDDGLFYAFCSINWTAFCLRVYDQEFNQVMDDIPLDYPEGEVCKSLKMYDGTLYACTNRISTIDMDGNVTVVPAIDDMFSLIYGFDIDNATGKMYFFGESRTGMGNIFACYDIKQEAIIAQSKRMSHDLSSEVAINVVSGGFFRTNFSGIEFYNQNCEFVRKEIVFGKDTEQIPTGWERLDIFVPDQSDAIYVAMTNDDLQSFIFKYTPTQGVKPDANADDNKIQLSVTAQYPQPFLTETIIRHNQTSKTSSWSIDSTYQIYQDFLTNSESAVTKMITKIMTNDVGDIVATGGMLLSTYDLFQTDAFVDLSDYIKNSPHYDNLNKNYLDAITIDDKIYGLPIGVGLECVVYNHGLAEELGLTIDLENITWSYLLELARQLERMELDDIYLLRNDTGYGRDVNAELRNMLLVNVSDLIDQEGKTVNFNQDWFIQLLKDFKEVSAYDCFIASESSQRSVSNYLFCEVPLISYTRLENFEGLYPQPLFLPAISGEINRNNLAYSYIMYSISSRSQNKDEAWGFLESLLDESMASLNSFNAIPLNTKAAEGQINNTSIFFENFPEQAEKINDVDTMYNYVNENYDDIVPVFMKYINDELTLDQAIEEAEYNVWLRLNE